MYFRRQSQRPCHPGGSALTLWPARNRKNVRKCPEMSGFLKKTGLRPDIAVRQVRPSEVLKSRRDCPVPSGARLYILPATRYIQPVITVERGGAVSLPY